MASCSDSPAPRPENGVVAVYMGSRDGNDPLFRVHAEQLGSLLAENNFGLVYGGHGSWVW